MSTLTNAQLRAEARLARAEAIAEQVAAEYRVQVTTTRLDTIAEREAITGLLDCAGFSLEAIESALVKHGNGELTLIDGRLA